MVHQPLADPRHIGHDLDAEIAQIAGRADPGAQQMRRRMDRPRRHDDLAPGLATRNSVSLPWTSALTPTQRVPSNSSPLTWVSAEIVRLSRSRVPGSR